MSPSSPLDSSVYEKVGTGDINDQSPQPVLPTTSLPSVALDLAEDAAALYARGSRAAATWRAYESDWRIFAAWCQSVDQAALPASPHTVALFLAAQARLGHAPGTLERRRAAIRLMHFGAKVASPHDALEVDEVLRGIRRAWKQPPRQKTPAIDADVQRLADAVEPQTRQGLRDRALVLWILPVRCAARSSWPSTWST